MTSQQIMDQFETGIMGLQQEGMNDQYVMDLLQKFRQSEPEIQFNFTEALAPGSNDLDLNNDFPNFIKMCENTV